MFDQGSVPWVRLAKKRSEMTVKFFLTPSGSDQPGPCLGAATGLLSMFPGSHSLAFLESLFLWGPSLPASSNPAGGSPYLQKPLLGGR